MTDTIDALKQAYRDVKAPLYLVTRIRAEVAGRPLRWQTWKPAAATAAAIAVLVWLGPFVGEHTATSSPVTSQPSLAAIMALKPDVPLRMSVSLSQLKTVKKPRLPVKPQPATSKPRTRLESDRDLLEEKGYVHS